MQAQQAQATLYLMVAPRESSCLWPMVEKLATWNSNASRILHKENLDLLIMRRICYSMERAMSLVSRAWWTFIRNYFCRICYYCYVVRLSCPVLWTRCTTPCHLGSGSLLSFPASYRKRYCSDLLFSSEATRETHGERIVSVGTNLEPRYWLTVKEPIALICRTLIGK